MSRFIGFLKKQPLLTAALAVAFSILVLKTVKVDGLWPMTALRILLSGTMLFFLHLISGDKTLSMSGNSTGYVIKVSLGFWIFAAVMGIAGLVLSFGSEAGIYEDWLPRLFLTWLLCLFVGLFEELAFRAILNDAIVYQFRSKKWAFAVSAICCALIFGAAHVVGAELLTPLAWAQAALKTVSSGLLGLALVFLYWRTRNIWACGIVHGMYDFFASFSSALFKKQSIGYASSMNYIMPDESALAAIILYGICIAVTLPMVILIWKKVGKQIDFADMRENW